MSLLRDLLGARKTRSGAVFSNIVTLPNHVDLEDLFAESERRRAERAGTESDVESVLTSLPSSRASSPLSELTDEEPIDQLEDASVDASTKSIEDAPTEPAIAKNSKARRSQAQRKRKREEYGNAGVSSKRHRAEKILNAAQTQASYDFSKAPVTSTGFTCLRSAQESGVPALEELEGFNIIDWNGRQTGAVTVNEDQVVMAILVGGGGGEGHRRVARAIETARGRMTFSAEERDHRRGLFCAKAIGVSHGGGQKQPGLLKHSDKNLKELLRITKLKPMRDIAHLNSSAFNNWQPDIHEEYAGVQKKLLGWKPRLRRFLNFRKSVWSCLTINFGPRTETVAHRDFGNLAHGFCAITALGNFNPDLGGHIVLRELRVAIRFPPGSSIIIPSALVTHYNTRIGDDETRYSVTQYTSGAIFRFVEHDFKLDEQYYGGLSAAGRRQAAKDNASRWRKGLAKLARLPRLRADAEQAGLCAIGSTKKEST
ncbi:hypothetical protein EV715DRAFT_297569 [Schizophyllum commune]